MILLSGCFLTRREVQFVPSDEFEPVEAPARFDSTALKTLPEADTTAFFSPSGVVRWPRDQDLVFFITYGAEVKLQMQWRQRCGSFDSDWYDMLEKGRIDDPLDADFMIKKANRLFSAEATDTVIVMASKMQSFPRSGCEWSFRSRLVSKRNIYNWVTLGERIVLADPGEFETIKAPKIELAKPEKARPN